MIGNGHYEREDSEFGNSVRRPGSPRYDALIDHSREIEIRGFAESGQNTTKVDSGSELS